MLLRIGIHHAIRLRAALPFPFTWPLPLPTPSSVTISRRPTQHQHQIPIFPCDKLGIEGGKSSIVLMRTGESRQGVIGLYQPGLPGQQGMGLSVRFMGISRKAIASYLVSLYCSLAVLTEDAIAVLENVDVGNYYDYK
jgi:hypothetical protein